MERPTGGGVDENGVEDDRMLNAAAADKARDVKGDNRLVNADIDEDTLKINRFFNESFPESVSGVGLMSENEATGGGDRKRGFCNIDGLNNDAVAEDLNALIKISFDHRLDEDVNTAARRDDGIQYVDSRVSEGK